jgi:arginase family enzyme
LFQTKEKCSRVSYKILPSQTFIAEISVPIFCKFVVDIGDIQFDSAFDPWELIERDVGCAMDAGHPLISLGGDHAITHPIMRAVRRRHAKLTIFHIDAHSDIYHAYQGNPRSHASPLAIWLYVVAPTVYALFQRAANRFIEGCANKKSLESMLSFLSARGARCF